MSYFKELSLVRTSLLDAPQMRIHAPYLPSPSSLKLKAGDTYGFSNNAGVLSAGCNRLTEKIHANVQETRLPRTNATRENIESNLGAYFPVPIED